MVDDGSVLIAPSLSAVPRDDARAGMDACSSFSAPQPGYREHVFFHEMAADPDGYVTAGLANPAFNGDQGFGFYVRYRKAELLCFNQWKMMGEGVYAVGLEPATNRVTGRAAERQRGTLQILQPGEQRGYHLEIGLLTGQVDIDRLQAGARQLIE